MDKKVEKEKHLNFMEYLPTSENSKDFYDISNMTERKEESNISNEFIYFTPISFEKKQDYVPSTPKKTKRESEDIII